MKKIIEKQSIFEPIGKAIATLGILVFAMFITPYAIQQDHLIALLIITLLIIAGLWNF